MLLEAELGKKRREEEADIERQRREQEAELEKKMKEREQQHEERMLGMMMEYIHQVAQPQPLHHLLPISEDCQRNLNITHTHKKKQSLYVMTFTYIL